MDTDWLFANLWVIPAAITLWQAWRYSKHKEWWPGDEKKPNNIPVVFDRHAKYVINRRFIGAAEFGKEPELDVTGVPEELVMAHEFSFRNRETLVKSELCGCFYCLEVFPVAEIIEWHDEGQTGFCPKCEIDALIGDATGVTLTKAFLTRMNQVWFG